MLFRSLANGLLEYETLTGNEITKVMNGESLVRAEDIDDIDDNDFDNDGVINEADKYFVKKNIFTKQIYLLFHKLF